MSNQISPEDLDTIFRRWNDCDIPDSVEEKATDLSIKVGGAIYDLMLFLLAPNIPDEQASNAIGRAIAALTLRPFKLCYFIGYELASGNIPRECGTPYLMAATEPIDAFVMQYLATKPEKILANQEKVSALSRQIARVTGEVSNDLCILGIENYRRARRR